MVLFEKFQKTVFVKDDCELEEKIDSLKAIRDKVVERDEIEKEIKISELGLIGEKRIEYELKCANIGMYVLHDVNVVVDDLTAQIDWVVVTPAYCYLIECKNLIGNVTVNAQGEFRRYYQYKGKKIAEAIYSTYRQAVRHKEILKKVWCARRRKIEIFFQDNIFESWYKPLVVFSNPSGILDVRYAPAEIKRNIVKVDNLIEYFKADIRKNASDLMSKKYMEENAISILKNINKIVKKDYTKRYTLVQSDSGEKQNAICNDELKSVEIAEADKIENQVSSCEGVEREDNSTQKNLEEELLKFRKEKSKNMNVPAYYIFTNDEMNKILEEKPRTLEELKKNNILSAIKIKCHGKEIIKIVNEFVESKDEKQV